MQTAEVGPYGENDIHAGGVLLPPQPEGLPDDALETISVDRTTNATMNTYAQPALPAIIAAADEGEACPVQTFAPAVDVFELAPLAQESAFEESIPGQCSGAKPLAPSGPAGLQDRTSATGAHSFPESVGALALENARLKGSFAHLLLPRRWDMATAAVEGFAGRKRSVSNLRATFPPCTAPPLAVQGRNDKLQKQNINHMSRAVSNLFDKASTATTCANPTSMLCFPCFLRQLCNFSSRDGHHADQPPSACRRSAPP